MPPRLLGGPVSPAWLSARPRACGSSPLAKAAAHSLARGGHLPPHTPAGTEVATLSCTLHPTVHLLVSPTGRNPENSPEAWEEFTEFAKAKKLNLEIFRPLQSGEKPTGAGCWLVPAAGPSAELMSTGRSEWGSVLAGVT